MARTLALATLLLTVACIAPPSQHDARVFGHISVALGPSLESAPRPWRADEAAELTRAFAELAALGPDVIVVDEGSAPDVIVRPFDSGPGCAAGAGRYAPGAAFVECDPACAGGYDGLRTCANHEVMHWLTWTRWRWVGHLCQHASDAPDCHPVVLCDPEGCLLQRGLRGSDLAGPGLATAWTPPVATSTPNTSDMALIARCQRNGRCD